MLRELTEQLSTKCKNTTVLVLMILDLIINYFEAEPT